MIRPPKLCHATKPLPPRLAILVAGDVLLIAGKGHETGQLIGNETLPFDDASVANNKIRTMREALQ